MKLYFFTCMMFFISVGKISAGLITQRLEFSKDMVSFEKSSDGFDFVNMTDAVNSGIAGDPQIPSIPLKYVLPVGAVLDSVEVVELQHTILDGTYKIRPIQPDVTPGMLNKTSNIIQNSKIYSKAAFYPANNVIKSSGSMSSFNIAGIIFYPLRYNPVERTLRLTTSIELRLHFKIDDSQPLSISKRQYTEIASSVKKVVKNPDDIGKCSPLLNADAEDDIHYAIITDAAFAKEFEPLQKWKTRKGYKTGIFTTSWIYEKYSGYDNAEKIRNFLKEYHRDKGLIYALLGGDYDKVPERDIFESDNSVATDFYYSDLDGTWDANNDHIYGNNNDSVDGYCDIMVGRAPVDNVDNVKTFVHKDTITEKKPPTEHQKKFLLATAALNGDSKYYLKDSLANTLAKSTTSGWYCSNFMHKKGSTSVVDSLNKGFSMCHIGSHGRVIGFIGEAIDDMVFQSDDLARLHNRDKLFFLFSMACYVGYYDYAENDCIGEKLMNMPDGGCVAAILNSRMGRYEVDSITKKLVVNYSERMCIDFNYNFFKKNEYIAGKCHAIVRNNYSDYAWRINGGDSKWIYVLGSWNLFGDPDLPMYQEIPVVLSVNHSKNISNLEQSFPVTVTSDGKPVHDALVCCYKGDEIYATGRTDSNGSVVLSVNPETNGTILVTVTARNHLPYEGESWVGSTPATASFNSISKTSLKSVSNTLNNKVVVTYSLAGSSDVKVQIFSPSGLLINSTQQKNMTSGLHEVSIRNSGTGARIIQFTAGDYCKVEKVFLLR